MPRIILITSCSVSRAVPPKVNVGDMPSGLNMKDALLWWTEKMGQYEPELTPREQYRGLGFNTLVKIQEAFPQVDAIKIVTGGLGLTDMDEKIVPYDFTADKNEHNNIWQKVTAEPFVQSVWWKMINAARGKSPTPIAEMVQNDPDAFFLVSCSKVFLRYIADDILSIPVQMRNRIRILLAASSVGSVPIQLRPMMVPFDRGAISHLPGNRNDGNHRASYHFLTKLLLNEAFQFGWEPGRQSPFFKEESVGGATRTSITTDKIEEILEANPAYLKMDPETVYKLIRREHGALGGRMAFRAIFRQAGGATTVGTVEMSDEESKAAADAMSGMSFLSTAGNGAVGSSDEDLAIQGCLRFVNTLKGMKADAIFTAADVAGWAEKFYQGNPPAFMKSPNKVVHILKNNVDYLGLREVAIQSGKAYQIAPSL